MVFPLLWLVSTSLRPAPELLFIPPHLLPDHWTLDNYAKAFASAPLLLYLWNSFVFAMISTVFILLTSTVAGYVFAKFSFPGNNEHRAAVAHVYVFSAKTFKFGEDLPDQASRSNHTVEFSLRDDFLYIIFYTGNTLVPFHLRNDV